MQLTAHWEVMMSPFTDKEVEYLRGQRLGRMATTGSNGAPHIVPVGFRLDPGAAFSEAGRSARSVTAE